MYDDLGRQIHQPGYAKVQPSPDVNGELRDDRRPHEVAMAALTNAVLRLESDDGFLRERVGAMLSPEAPHEVEAGQTIPGQLSPITTTLHDLAARIDASCARIETVLDRLEI